MRHKDIQERLHGLDTSAADRLMDEYPPAADTDAQFRKTYDRYLAQTGEQDASPRRSPLRILRFAAYPVAAAACIALILAIAQNAPLTRPDDLTQQETPATAATTTPPETTAPLPAAETAAIETTAPVLATQETDVSLPAVTAPAVTQTAPSGTTKNAASATSPTVTTAAPSPANASPTNDAGPAPTQAPTEAAPPAVTDPAPTEAPTEAAPAVTDPAPTDPPTDPPIEAPGGVTASGQFTVTPQPGSDTMLLRYELTTDAPADVTEHRFDVPGFTESGRNVVNVSANVRATTVSLDDEAGQHYSVQIYPYEAFHMTYLTSYYTTAQEVAVNGIPIYLLASDDPEGIAMVFWDDGCQICFVISQVKDLGQMERLVSRIAN